MADVPENNNFKTVHDMATEQLAELGPSVIAEVASRMAQREVQKRADKMVQAIDKIATLTLEHKKLGPDDVRFNAKGEKESESYTKKRIDEINKSKSNIEKLQAAVAKAHTTGDYSDIDKLLGSGQKPQTEGGTKDSGDVAGGTPPKDS